MDGRYVRSDLRVEGNKCVEGNKFGEELRKQGVKTPRHLKRFLSNDPLLTCSDVGGTWYVGFAAKQEEAPPLPDLEEVCRRMRAIVEHAPGKSVPFLHFSEKFNEYKEK